MTTKRRGMIFVIALGIITVLSAMLLVFAQSMRVEAVAAANRVGGISAASIEQGAERWVLAQVNQNKGDAATITQLPAEALPVGDGYFWILRFYPDDSQQYDFGIMDETTKVNINTADANALLDVPGMTEDLADAIIDWRDSDDDTGGQGAESDYYESLADPYQSKNAPFETVGELLLVKGFTPDVLFGYDQNHNGVLDVNESAAGGAGTLISNLSGDTRGLFNYLTVYGPATSGTSGRGGSGAPGSGGSSGSGAGGQSGRGGAGGGSGGQSGGGGGSGGGGRNSANSGASGGSGSSGNATPGGTGGSGNAGGAQVEVYSADIVAVTANGRAYKRVRIIVNAGQSSARIVYRKDLTGMGWPLPEEIRTALRQGQQPPTGLGVSGTGIGSLPMGQRN